MEGVAPQRHFVGVWNPAYAVDAMDAHLDILVSYAKQHREQRCAADSVYVWWARVRSRSRHQPMPHEGEAREIAALLNSPDGAGNEVQLYLTDYRALYVAHVTAVRFDEVRDADAPHVPPYLLEREPTGSYRFEVDCWFKLLDVRRLVADGTTEVVEQLRALRNTHYHGERVSLYGGMVDLPLIVTRPDGRHFFDREERESLADLRSWAELDAERGKRISAMERELRDNVLGEEAWRALDPAARGFLAEAELIFRERRSDPAYDFSPVVVSLAKAVEVQFRTILRAALADAPAEAREVRIHDRVTPIGGDHKMPALGQMAIAISDNPLLKAELRKLEHGQWFAKDFRTVAVELTKHRNPAAHDSRTDRETATHWRNRLLGVGCQGVLVELAKVRVVR